ncbi:MAG: 3-hydroxyacyl-ACP dehydratase [Bacteroidales bacterium]|nr:3-hydroxyacyl-ACP dehydratase [Bacteroidales bacterium]
MPFVMVDTLCVANENETITQFTIPDSNPLVFDGIFSESGLLENIAQSAACGVGYICKQKNIEVPVGFIGAIKKINIFEIPKVGDCIETKITTIANIMDASIISALIECNGKVIASCEMNIFLKKTVN